MATIKENITLLPYRERTKLVRERLQWLRSPKVIGLYKPAKVLAAEKIVAEWEAKNETHLDAQRASFREKKNAVIDALIVGDTQKAVALLQKLGA